jgi:hypothetical protein
MVAVLFGDAGPLLQELRPQMVLLPEIAVSLVHDEDDEAELPPGEGGLGQGLHGLLVVRHKAVIDGWHRYSAALLH